MAGPNDQAVYPIDIDVEQKAPHLTIDSYYKADDGSEWLWTVAGYTQVVAPWAVEGHIPPVNKTQKLGDVESWVAYVKTYGTQTAALLLVWSEAGLAATLDHPTPAGVLGRGTWRAEHPFEKSDQWKAWKALADDRPRSQREAVERLDDLAADIKEPASADVLAIVRKLRATVNVQADAELQSDGTTKVEYKGNTEIRSGELTLPPSITIAIPVLKGHTAAITTEAGDEVVVPVKYEIVVKIRVAADNNGQVTLRFAMPDAERVLEAVYADRVAAARVLLGGLGDTLLRATT